MGYRATSKLVEEVGWSEGRALWLVGIHLWHRQMTFLIGFLVDKEMSVYK